MKKIFFLITTVVLLSSCKQETNNVTEKENTAPTDASIELWAEQVSSNTDLVKPDGWSDADWNSVTKNVEQQKIYDAVMEAVLIGAQQAYDYLTDSALTADQVKERIKRSNVMIIDDGKITKEVMKTDTVKATDISMIRVNEKWYFDKEKFKLEKRATAMTLFTSSYAEDGSFRGHQALFYVKLNN